jgi:hypothetical protein
MNSPSNAAAYFLLLGELMHKKAITESTDELPQGE